MCEIHVVHLLLSGMRFVIKSYNSVNKPISNVSSNKLLSKFIIYTLQQFDFS